jgi:hypothetical protein
MPELAVVNKALNLMLEQPEPYPRYQRRFLSTRANPRYCRSIFRCGETSPRLSTTVATLGTPRDATLREVRVECFFPMDDASARRFRQWADGG